MSNFCIGQKVVCVFDFEPQGSRWNVRCPVVGTVYTVRDFESRGTVPALRLVEVINEIRPHHNVPGVMETAFDIDAFRPVVARKTDISIFKQMLNTHGENAYG